MITPYNEIGAATTGGTWDFVGSQLSYPTPPSAYNANMDVSTFKAGMYNYTYTVTNGTCTSVISYVLNLKNSRNSFNNECIGAITINTHNLLSTGISTLTNQYLSDEDLCASDNAILSATLSVDTLPTNWSPSPTADTWYKILLPQSNTTGSIVTITFNSIEYDDTGLSDSYVALYTGTCGALVEEDSVPPSQENTVSISYEIPTSNTNPYLYIRIGSVNGGYFNIDVNSYAV